jgi:YidC/Oxa1 family membrane protein insertase
MDRKSIIVLVVCLLLLLAWPSLINKLYPPVPRPQGTNTAVATNLIVNSTQTVTAATQAEWSPSVPSVPAAIVPAGTPEETLVVTNENARYTFTSHGGGLKGVALTGYPESVGCFRKRNAAARERWATLNTGAPLPVLALVGDAALQGDGLYTLSPAPGGVRMEKQLTNGLHVVKEFHPASNYLVNVTLRIENRSGQMLALPPQQLIAGTAMPLNPQDDETMVGFYWYDGRKDYHADQGWFANKTLGCFPGTPRHEYREGANNVHWSAVDNQFFALALMPRGPAMLFIAHKVSLPPPSKEEIASDPKTRTNQFALQTSVIFAPTNLADGAVLEHQFTLFAGPKEYRTLDRIGAQFKNDIDRLMGYTGPFGFFSKALLLSMNGIHSLFGGMLGYGWVIIIITVLLKLLFWPLTQASTRSMKKMQALQPQVKAIQAKYKDDPQKMQQKMMALWKEHKVSPVSGCLPMLVQIPVFIGFFMMVRSAIELRGAQFLWACDLSSPDTIFYLPFPAPFGPVPVNPLSILMGVTMFWQARMTPVSPGVDPAQQKIMKYMPLMFLVILYNYSAGLTLYWTVQNLLTIAQMKLTRSKEKAGTPAPVPVAPSPAAPAPAKKKRKK